MTLKLNCLRAGRVNKKRERRTRWFKNLRDVNRQIADVEKGLESNKAYEPVCLGGMEDRWSGIRYYERRLSQLEADRSWLAGKLGLSYQRARQFA